MAMLAEPRRRQKWSLNPRGTLWSDDENKFGQKLMEKMGWNKGEGLGKDGQGMTEAIKANYKDNNKGIGFKGKDDEWLKNIDAFENVLAALNSSENNSANNSAVNSASNSPASSEDEGEKTNARRSLEKRSKDSRARVHYHKFTRGKDLSNYNEDDLACILGSKKSKRKDIESAAPEEKEKEEVIDEKEKKEEFIGEEVGTTKKEHGLVTIIAGNYQEYFARKMAALKQREGNEINIHDIQNKTHGKEELSALKIDENTSLETKKSKKKKKKDKDNEHSDTHNNSNTDQNEENCSSANESMVKERKKKKCKAEVSNSNMLEQNCIKEDGRPVFGFEFSCGFTNGSTVMKYPLNTCNIFSSDNEAEIIKAEKNLKKNGSPNDDIEIDSPKDKKKKHNEDQGSSDETVECKEKKKKKKSKDTSYKVEDFTVISKNEITENTFEEVVKKKKKKKCKDKDVEKISIVIENKNATEFEEKEKVKKKKIIEEIISNDCLPENADTKKKKKKKKKNKNKLEDNSVIMGENSTETKSNIDGNVNLNEKRKGKKRKREEEKNYGTNESSDSKKFKKITDLSQGASLGKHKLKRQEYWRKKADKNSKKKKKGRKEKHCKIKDKDALAKKVLKAFEGAKVPNIITKRDKKKLEQSSVT